MAEAIIPEGACDTHIHVFRAGAPTIPGALAAPHQDDVEAYRKLRDSLGLQRTVIVQANAYGTDNSVAMDGIACLGLKSARGVAVVDEETSDAHLVRLHDAGFRGMRFHMMAGGILDWSRLDRIAGRAVPMGWHIQLQLDGCDLPQRLAQIRRWQAPVVIDHLGKFSRPPPPDDAAFKALLDLIDGGRTWVKLSAPYEVSRDTAPDYADVSALARALVAHAPERLLWASNWPHILTRPRPDDGALLALLSDWVPDPAIRRRILSDNPATVYGFGD